MWPTPAFRPSDPGDSLIWLRPCRHVALPGGDEGGAPAAVRRDLALQPGDDGRHPLHQLGVLAEALVAPAPPWVPADLSAEQW